MADNRCCICRMTTGVHKIKRGWICEECMSALPLSLQHGIASFTPEHAREAVTAYRRAYRLPWISVGGFALTDRSVQLNGFEYPLDNLRSVRYEFHPVEMGDEPGLALGSLGLVLETARPHMILEEKFTRDDEVCAAYVINGTEISYRFSKDLAKLLEIVNEAILSRTYDLAEAAYEWKATHVWGGRRTEQGNWNAAGNAGGAGGTAGDAGWTAGGTGRAGGTEEPGAFEAARRLYGLEMPYTLEQLKRARRELAKKCHPDAGGSDEQFKKVMEAYEVLEAFASS